MDTQFILIQIGKIAAVIGMAVWLVKEIGVFILKKGS